MSEKRQHTKPCKECPFRRQSLPGYLGGNDPQWFAVVANHENNLECHMTMHRKEPAQCAGRAVMWANQLRIPRVAMVPELEKDKLRVFSHISEFIKHHKITITPEQLIGLAPLDSELNGEERE